MEGAILGVAVAPLAALALGWMLWSDRRARKRRERRQRGFQRLPDPKQKRRP